MYWLLAVEVVAVLAMVVEVEQEVLFRLILFQSLPLQVSVLQ
jgi:hypothetical protein